MVAKAVRITIVGVVLYLLVIGEAAALPGDLDPSFGGDGIVYTAFVRSARATGVALQPDGKIVAVGALGFFGDTRFAVARYLADGNPDPTFGGDGRISTNLTRRADFATDLAIQPDGKIVVVGRSGGSGGQFAVLRYESDGSLDASFGGDGIEITNFTVGDDIASAVALQSDGAIVVAGTSKEGFVENSRFALARYLADGSLDPAFSSDGRVATNFTNGRDTANAVAIQADDKIVVVGRAGGAHGRFALAMYMPDGVRDSTFGTSGRVMTNFSKWDDIATDLAIQSDGKLVVVGVGGLFFSDRHNLARYTQEGMLDDTFGGDGRVRSIFGAAQAVALGADGKILVGGSRGGASGCETTAMLSRFTTTGAIDGSFGDEGTTMTSFIEASDAQDLVIQPDGAIVVAGGAHFCGLKSSFAVLRYLAA